MTPSCHSQIVSISRRLLAAVLGVSVAGVASASALVYQPVNPAFGGNPLNASGLLNEANAQNDFRAPAATPADRLDAFANSLQSAILSRVSSAVIRSIVGGDGLLIPGRVETQDFIIDVVQSGDIVTVTTTDRTTGQQTTFQISNTPNPP